MRVCKKVLGTIVVSLLLVLSFNINILSMEIRRDSVVTAISHSIFASTTHTITYHTNGGTIVDPEYITTFDDSTPDTVLPIATKSGYKFNGWYLDNSFNLESKVDRIDSEIIAMDTDIALFASWTPRNYMVEVSVKDSDDILGISYEADMVNGIYKSTHDSEYHISITLCEGYTRSGEIHLEIAGSNIAHDSVDGYTYHFTIPTSVVNNGNMHIVVVGVRLDTVTVNYTYDGDTTSDTTNHGEDYIISDTLFTRDGYQQIGWECESVEYDFLENIVLQENMTFTPIWDTVEYTATFDMNGATSESIDDYTFTVLGSKSIDNPTRVGYDFIGWTGTGLSTPTKDLVIGVGSFGDREYVANWRLIPYAIEYNLDGGILEHKIESYTVATPDIVLPTPTRVGYTFTGWTRDSATITKIAHGSMGDVSVRANWSLLTYDIYYDTLGGTMPSSAVYSYTILDEVTLVSPTKDGYIFGGWYQNSSYVGSKVQSISTGSTGTLTVYAKWLVNTLESIDSSIEASITNASGMDIGLTMSITKLKNLFELVQCHKYIDEYDFDNDIRYEVKQVYDIHLLDNAVVVDEFSGTYEVRILVDEFYANTSHAVVLVEGADGTIEALDTHIDGSYLVFYTEHFSRFVFVGQSVDTLGDMQWVIFVMILLMSVGVIVATTLIVYSAKKEYFHKLFRFISSDLDIK